MRSIRIFVCLFVFFLLVSCSSNEKQESDLTVFRYNESKGITSLDPAFARNQTIIWPVNQLFNGLVQLDDSLKVMACIARKWIISNAGRSYTFYLRDDVYFHESPYFSHQRRVNAHDFVYSLMRIKDPEIASPGAWIFDYLDKSNPVVARDDTTLIINLAHTFPPFLSILAMPYCSVVPKEVVENPDADFAHHPVGTGPFRFKLWSTDEKLILLKNHLYFEQDNQGVPLPYLDAVSITFIKDKQSEFLEFLKGNLDFLSGVHPAYKDELLTRSGRLNPKYADKVKLLTQAYLNTEYLGILQEPASGSMHPLLDKNVRKAINYGFDREKMMKYLRNNLGYPATGGMIPPGLPGHLDYGEGYTYNPDLAREYLRKSTYGEGKDMEDITLTTTSDYLDLCEYIQYELSKIGIPIKLSVSTGGAFRNMVASANLQFFRASWIADYADAENYLALFYSGNHTPDGPNYTRFSSSDFDLLYEESFAVQKDEDRFRIYREMDRIVIEEAPVIPLYYDMVVRFVHSDIQGFTPNPMNNMILKTVWKSENTDK